jgi:hypothetical protein
MKNSTKLALVCAMLFCVVLAVLGWREEFDTTAAAPSSAPPVLERAEELVVARQVEAAEREVAEKPEAAAALESVAPPAEGRPREKQPGFLRGHIVDGSGAALPEGRVQVFRKADDSEPLAEADIEGPEHEYRFTLPSDRPYYVSVDPASVARFGEPPVARGLARAERAPDGSIPSNQYTRWWVRIPEGETVWQDLLIARLGEVTGRLLDAQGQPIPGIVSRLIGLESINSGHSQDDLTDVEGIFHHREVFPGSHRLAFFSPKPSDFEKPLPTDVLLASGEIQDVGDIRVQSGTCAVVGLILDQDGHPFAGVPVAYYPGPREGQKNPPGLTDILRRATTDAEGAFELSGLPTGQGKISLTPNYEPNKDGTGPVAFWEPNVEVYLSENQPVTDIGVHVVQQSRPFRLEGDLLGLVPASHRGKLRATVSEVGPPLPDVRRAALKAAPVKVDWEAGRFECLIETPRREVELRFELKGLEDLVFLITPEPWGVWTQEVRVPHDFTPRK